MQKYCSARTAILFLRKTFELSNFIILYFVIFFKLFRQYIEISLQQAFQTIPSSFNCYLIEFLSSSNSKSPLSEKILTYTLLLWLYIIRIIPLWSPFSPTSSVKNSTEGNTNQKENCLRQLTITLTFTITNVLIQRIITKHRDQKSKITNRKNPNNVSNIYVQMWRGFTFCFQFSNFLKKDVTFEIGEKTSKISTNSQENTEIMAKYKKLTIGVTNEMFRFQ